MSDKFHAVHSVSAAGVFDSWASARLHVDRVEGAVHRSFPTEQEARDWLAMHQAPSPAAAYDDEDGEQTPSAPLAEYLPYMGHENKRKRDTARGGADMGFSGYLLDGQEDLGLVRAAEPLSAEQEAVVQVCLAGHNVLIAGEAGTGKSHLLRELIERLKVKHGHDKVFCTASTGIA
jgi:Cdc6-like AAA superfamily ATPase